MRGDAVGDVVFYGKGAGKLPTASAVVSDIVIAARSHGTSKTMWWEDCGGELVIPYKELSARFYVRAKTDRSTAEKLFGAVRFLSRDEAPDDEIAFVTPEIGEAEFEEKCGKLEVLGSIRVLGY